MDIALIKYTMLHGGHGSNFVWENGISCIATQ